MVNFSRILVTGDGQLACALSDAFAGLGELSMLGRGELDVSDEASVLEVCERLNPSLIMHTAALTKVAYCEQHIEEATRINANGTENIIAAARRQESFLVYFSTDYALAGTSLGLRLESEKPAPLNIYGASKAIVEQPVLGYGRSLVVRTSGVFGPRQNPAAERNFFRFVFQKLSAGEAVSIVKDQYTAITYAPHLAELLRTLLSGLSPDSASRLIHLTCKGAHSWFEWARLFAECANLDADLVKPMLSADYTDPTPRPRYSVLGSIYPDITALSSTFPAALGLQVYAAHLNACAANC